MRLLGATAGSNFFRLVLLSVLVYNANLRSITSFDTNSTRYLPISILTEFDLDLDEFPFLLEYPLRNLPPDLREGDAPPAYWVQHTKGHYYSTFPVTPAILAIPVYAIPVLLGLTSGSDTGVGLTRTEVVGTALSKLSASIAVGLSVGIVYLTALRLTTARAAVGIALVYGFATSSWSVASQGLWQTAMSEPLLVLALYCLVRGRERGAWVVLAGLPLALSVACRPPTLIFAACLSLYVAHRHPQRLVAFAILPIGIGSLLLAHNLTYFDHPLGGYAMTGPSGYFSPPGLKRFLGLLVSPSRGLLIYSPVLVFAFAGLIASLVRRRDMLLVYVAVSVLATILFYSGWENWHGHFSYSYRHLVDILPAMALFLPGVWSTVWRSRVVGLLFALLAIQSVLAQAIGVFCYPCDWWGSPVSASADPGRFWDWSDPEMLRCLRAGPVEPDGVRLLRSLLAR